MIRYTASYANTNSNFVIKNIRKRKDIERLSMSVICVIKNILQRSRCVNPSEFLKSRLGNIPQSGERVYYAEKYVPQWNKTIKGSDETGTNPALKFFEEVLPKYLKEFSFITQLIIPEAFIDELLDKKILKNQQVDFYVPQLKTVIEIDGYQHKENGQSNQDKFRDGELKKNNIEVYRFTTKDVRTESEYLQKCLNDMLNKCRMNKALVKYKDVLYNLLIIDPIRIKYDTIMRMQCLLLSLLENGIISLNDAEWEFKIDSDIKEIDSFIYLAWEDLFCWMKNLLYLTGKRNIQFPKVTLKKTKSAKTICVDISLNKRLTDEDNDKNTIYIRTDYFDEKNYFRVSIAEPIQYSVDMQKTEDIECMERILNDLFVFGKKTHKKGSFRTGQLPIIAHCLSGKSTIGILPTGGGKSLCYQFCVLLQPRISFVVSPITALINDQYRRSVELGISNVGYIHSGVGNGERKEKIISDFADGKYMYMLISPERFQSESFRKKLSEISVNRDRFGVAVIDEVHCLSEWGHDFRTSYLVLVDTIKKYCGTECWLLGLTATASRFVLEDVRTAFGVTMDDVKTIGSMNRPELRFRVIKTEKKYDELKKLLEIKNPSEKEAGLIFTIFAGGKRFGATSLIKEIRGCFKEKKKELTTGVFTSKLKDDEKKKVQDDFVNDEIALLVATKAFGMGIDKSNVRFTVHYNLPWSIESFYQEAGRAGRDGKYAECYIIYTPENYVKIKKEEIYKKLFSIYTSYGDILEIDGKLEKDLSRIMYLWLLNNKGIDFEVNVAKKILAEIELKKENTSHITIVQDFMFKEETEENKIKVDPIDVEKGIYRLKILGYIRDWTVEYLQSFKPSYQIEINDKISQEDVEFNLYKYIKKYDNEFSLYSHLPRYTSYVKINEDENIFFEEKMLKILISWTYDNILYERRQSIKNMMELCDTYTTDSVFKHKIEQYLSYDDCEVLLNVIANNPLEYNNWISFFHKTDTEDINNIKKEFKGKENLVPQIEKLKRFLESYRFNTGLNYLSGILHLFNGDFENPDGKQRFCDALDSIEKNEILKNHSKEILYETLRIVNEADMTQKNEFSKFMMERYGDKVKYRLYEMLHDEYSLSVLLNECNKRIQHIKELIK